jgi:hypothetical protein
MTSGLRPFRRRACRSAHQLSQRRPEFVQLVRPCPALRALTQVLLDRIRGVVVRPVQEVLVKQFVIEVNFACGHMYLIDTDYAAHDPNSPPVLRTRHRRVLHTNVVTATATGSRTANYRLPIQQTEQGCSGMAELTTLSLPSGDTCCSCPSTRKIHLRRDDRNRRKCARPRPACVSLLCN